MTRNTSQPRLLFILLAALALAPLGQSAPSNATITYRRVFKGSTPEFIEIRVAEPGKSTFDIRQLEEDPAAETFEVGPPVRQKIFELAADLKNFAIADLDIQKRIANLGQKTFRYERGSEVHETTFNYTLNTSVKYDRLGVNDALRQFESDMDHRLLPEPERLLAVLDQIGADSHFVEIARTRARALAERIRTSRDH